MCATACCCRRECYFYAKICLRVTDTGVAVPSRKWHCDRALATTLAQWGVEPLLIPEFADPRVVEALWHLRTISQSLHAEMYEGEGQTLLHGAQRPPRLLHAFS